MSINDRIFLTENFQLFEFTRSTTRRLAGFEHFVKIFFNPLELHLVR
jgi:hypothetical protein